MHRLTARILLTLLLAGTIAPLALAIATPAPHACCMRKPMHGATAPNVEFHAPLECCGHDCCRTLTVSQWAHATLLNRADGQPARSRLELAAAFNKPATPDAGRVSARGPPQTSMA